VDETPPPPLNELAVFAGRHYPELAGVLVPANMVMAYLFYQHEHLGEDGEDGPYVNSAALGRWLHAYADRIREP
jgi:hypothetical protein